MHAQMGGGWGGGGGGGYHERLSELEPWVPLTAG